MKTVKKSLRENVLVNRLRPFKESKLFVLLLSAILGIFAGHLSIVFRKVADFAKNAIFIERNTGGESLLTLLSNYVPIFIAIILIILYSNTSFWGARGFSSILKAVFKNHGHLSLNNSLKKLGLSLLSILGKGSIGRESMIAQCSGGFGSWLGRLFHLSSKKTVRLIVSSAAAAIAATYGAPIAGILFAIELLVEEVHVALAPMIIASLSASLVVRSYGLDPVINIQFWDDVPAEQLYIFAILGISSGLLGALYSHSSNMASKKLYGKRFSPAFGGIIIFLFLIYAPNLTGGGYQEIGLMLETQPLLKEALFYVFGKALITVICINSGWAGGHFGPIFSIGIALGLIFGTQFTNISSSLAIAGAAALCASVTHAPLALIILIWEMTNTSQVFIPVTIAVLLAVITRDFFNVPNLYESPLIDQISKEKKKRKGKIAKNIMQKKPITVTEDEKIKKVYFLIKNPTLVRAKDQTYFPVLRDGKLIGAITRKNILHALEADIHGELNKERMDESVKKWVSGIEEILVVKSDDSLAEIAHKMRISGISTNNLPVVNNLEEMKVVGILKTEDIIKSLKV